MRATRRGQADSWQRPPPPEEPLGRRRPKQDRFLPALACILMVGAAAGGALALLRKRSRAPWKYPPPGDAPPRRLALRCSAWRQAPACDAAQGGEWERSGPSRPCDALIPGGVAGRCECLGGSPVAVPCARGPLRCAEVCLSGELPAPGAFPTPVSPAPYCEVGWQQTGGCDGDNGPREPAGDHPCGTVVQPGWSGYCLCSRSPERRTMGWGCAHPAFTCSAVCAPGGERRVRAIALSAAPAAAAGGVQPRRPFAAAVGSRPPAARSLFRRTQRRARTPAPAPPLPPQQRALESPPPLEASDPDAYELRILDLVAQHRLEGEVGAVALAAAQPDALRRQGALLASALHASGGPAPARDHAVVADQPAAAHASARHRLKLDADGRAYTLAQFLEYYGVVEGAKRYRTAKPVPPAGDGAVAQHAV
eukprot:TRINITY_DN31375_c0_g1_i1.p1 TRINITY_DN31375_c0_g1~~TRINITY_DN31375_c0_g1_i1.p1  ORF type:complete len:423 (+),score=88.78 TRINITY_DN31375_c0_g1_i1:73-1341(+)